MIKELLLSRVLGSNSSGGSTDEEEFIGVKLSNFRDDTYHLPMIADARSISKMMTYANHFIFNNLFENKNPCSNGGGFVALEEIYLPDGVSSITNTFKNCISLKTIYGDLSNVTSINGSFTGCSSLLEVPYMPNVDYVYANALQNCVALTSFTFYKICLMVANNAFNGCSNLTDVKIPQGWNLSLYLHYSENLTQECLHKTIENFADNTGSDTSLILRIGEKNILKIDEEHLTMLDNKNIEYS